MALCNLCLDPTACHPRGAEPTRVAGSKAKPPEWAYGTGPAEALRPASPQFASERTAIDDSRQHLPGSSLAFTRKEANDPFNPADWYPSDHPKMPDIVAHGASPPAFGPAISVIFRMERAARKCCRIGSARLLFRPPDAGLPCWPSPQRRPRKKNTALMIAYAKAMTDEEIKSAAEYFGAMPWNAGTNPWIGVVETDTVPKTRLSSGLYIPIEGREANLSVIA